MKQLLVQLAASKPSLSRRPIDEAHAFEKDVEEGEQLLELREAISRSGSAELMRLWKRLLHEALPPGRDHEHPHRKHLLQLLSERLGPDGHEAFAVSSDAYRKVRDKALSIYATFIQNDAFYSK